jgi:hypothetical protein
MNECLRKVVVIADLIDQSTQFVVFDLGKQRVRVSPRPALVRQMVPAPTLPLDRVVEFSQDLHATEEAAKIVEDERREVAAEIDSFDVLGDEHACATKRRDGLGMRASFRRERVRFEKPQDLGVALRLRDRTRGGEDASHPIGTIGSLHALTTLRRPWLQRREPADSDAVTILKMPG